MSSLQQQHTSVINEYDEEYNALIRKVLKDGVESEDRTGTGTLSYFGYRMEFDLSSEEHYFPLLTTKKVFWRGVVEELLWIINGKTDSQELAAKNVHFWDSNGSADILSKLGFGNRKEGDLGPVYGFQWRYSGAKYIDSCTRPKDGEYVDQFKNCIKQIISNPNDRRIIINAWNPSQNNEMALPPCHVMTQFYVRNGIISCTMFQRSGDIGLGIPFNIASYSLLLRIIAHVCCLKPGKFVHMIGDAHIYNDHVEALQYQLQKKSYQKPSLYISDGVGTLKNMIENGASLDEKVEYAVKVIEGIKFEDLILENYRFHNAIPMKMSV